MMPAHADLEKGPFLAILLDDLRRLTVELSGRSDGEVVRVSDKGLIGAGPLDLDRLFAELAIGRGETLSEQERQLRKEVFEAR